MRRDNLEAQLKAAEKEAEELMQEKMLIDMRLGHLSQTIQALTSLLQSQPVEPVVFADGDELFGETGITGAIRFLLTNSKLPLSPTQIRTELMDKGFDLSSYSNAMAVIHNTLKRLDSQGELMTVKNPSGQIVGYTTRWRGNSTVDDLKDALKADRIAKARAVFRKK
jgi:hypothetical protein